jgi:hypothetical protein
MRRTSEVFRIVQQRWWFLNWYGQFPQAQRTTKIIHFVIPIGSASFATTTTTTNTTTKTSSDANKNPVRSAPLPSLPPPQVQAIISPFDDYDGDVDVSFEMNEIIDLQEGIMNLNFENEAVEGLSTNEAPNSDMTNSVPSILSPTQVWQSWTEQVLRSKDDNSDSKVLPTPSIFHLDRLIKWWARQRPFTTEAAVTTWKLLDVVEFSINRSSAVSSELEEKERTVTQNLVNVVLDHWRLSALAPNVSVPYGVFDVWKRLQNQHAHSLNIRTYAILLSAISRQSYNVYPQHSNVPNNSIDFACEVLHHYLIHRTSATVAENEKPSVLVLWNSILTVIAKQGGGANVGEQAEMMLRQMVEDLSLSQMKPDEISYACVLEAWAQAAELNPAAGINAERLLQEMVEQLGRHPKPILLEGGDELVELNVRSSTSNGVQITKLSVEKAASTCYLHVLRAHSKTASPDGADRAERLLQRMIRNFLVSIHGSGGGYVDAYNSDVTPSSQNRIYPNMKPTRHCFSAVMAGYADRGRLADVERLLLSMQSLYETSGGDPLLYPTTATFNSVLEAYAQQGTPASAERAQQLLERLHKNALKADTSSSTSNESRFFNRPCQLDTTSVNTCIDAWARSGAPDAVERAEALLHAASQWAGVSPDRYSYTTVMKAWANSDRPNASEQCEGILWSMWERYRHRATDEGIADPAKPNDVTYATAIYSWSKETRNPDAPFRAEALYKDMLVRYENGDHSLKPSLPVYNLLISTWAQSKIQGSDVRAQLYFDRLRGDYMAGDDSLRPTDKVYNALISSKKLRSDGEGAETILNYMYDDYLNCGNKGAVPNRFVFHSVMAAWVNSAKPHPYKRIEVLLKRMYHEHQTRRWDCKPSDVSYTLLINCLAKVGTRDAAIRAESVLQHMYDLSTSVDRSVKPCRYSCGGVIQAWANTGRVAEAPYRAQAIFDEMIRRSEGPRGDVNMRPNSFTYNSLLTTWARSSHADAAERALAILQGMENRHALDGKSFDPPGPFHYAAVIGAFGNKQDVAAVENLLQRMIVLRIQPHSGVLNSVLKAYSKASHLPDAVERAEKLLRSMESKYSVRPDVFSYTTFIVCLQRSRRPDAFRRARQVLDEMIQLSSQSNREGNVSAAPSVVTFGILLNILQECSGTSAAKIKELNSLIAVMDQVQVEPSPALQQDILKIRLATGDPIAPIPRSHDGSGSIVPIPSSPQR